MQYFTRNRGFTIVELLVVIAIIGILGLVGNIAYNEVQKAARDEIRMTEVTQISLALAAYKQEFGYYPQEADGYSGHDGTGGNNNLVDCDNHRGRIFADPNDSVCGSLNPLSALLEEYAGHGFQDPLYNDDLSGGWGGIYWYYYDEETRCDGVSADLVAIKVRTMETDKYPNRDEINALCDDGIDDGWDIGIEGGRTGDTYIHVVDWVPNP